jgi:hypothetical protein
MGLVKYFWVEYVYEVRKYSKLLGSIKLQVVGKKEILCHFLVRPNQFTF